MGSHISLHLCLTILALLLSLNSYTHLSLPPVIYIYIYIYTYIHDCILAHIHTHAHSHTCTCTLVHIRIHMNMNKMISSFQCLFHAVSFPSARATSGSNPVAQERAPIPAKPPRPIAPEQAGAPAKPPVPNVRPQIPPAPLQRSVSTDRPGEGMRNRYNAKATAEYKCFYV